MGSVETECADTGKLSMKLLKTNVTLLEFGIWNVRGLHAIGKFELLKSKMEKTGVEILGANKVKWRGTGHFESGEYKMFYSGTNSTTGVAFLVHKRISGAILGYNPISDRVITLRIQAKPTNLTPIQVYAPNISCTRGGKHCFLHDFV